MSGRIGRRSGGFTVCCRTRGHTAPGHVHALNTCGCLLDAGNGFLSAGDRVTLRFDNAVRIVGTVTLLNGRAAGIRFDPPLHEAVYEHLLALGRESQIAPRTHRAAGAAMRPL